MIDAHCHIDYIKDAESAIEESIAKGVSAMVTSALNREEASKVFALKKKFPTSFYICLGVHPIQVDVYNDEYVSFIRENKKNIVAIGEIGLDGLKATKDYARTVEVFKKMIVLASELKLPIVVHSRNGEKKAISDSIKILSDNGAKNVMLHCFSGSDGNLKDALDLGFYVSYATNICWTKKHPPLAKDTPLDRMLLETDAPWLDPDSTIDNIKLNNRPWKITKSAEVIADVKGIKASKVLETTANNARKFFNIP